MSDLGFDVRGYCSRLAKACPERFTFIEEVRGNNPWRIEDSVLAFGHSRNVWDGCHIDYLWMFFGPIADERKGRLMIPLKGSGSAYELRTDTLLESIIAAVVESFESQNESEAKS